MRYRRIGRTGPAVSAITYGTGSPKSGTTDTDALSRIRAALDAGITTFDTADVYGGGRSEERLGRALKGVPRDSIQIMTKVGFPTGPGPHDRGLSRTHIATAIDGSLRRLQTDYVDVYQAHRYDTDTPLGETMSAFADLVGSGKVRYVGVSEWRADQIQAAQVLAADLSVPLVSNQCQYSALWRVIEPEVLPACRAAGLGALAWSPLCQGVLTGKYLPGTRPPAGSRGADPVGAAYVRRCASDQVLGGVQRLWPIADSLQLSLTQLAIAWVLARPGVATAIIGASHPDQIREVAGAASVDIDPSSVRAMDDALGGLVDTDSTKVGDPYRTMAQWQRDAPDEAPW